ncbi:MAG: ribonuclease Z [Clostridia bacterium]|nr:ribonuclease Z [Clostridia bacterium]
MKVILTLDDRFGMLFNRRRQSRDRILIDRLTDLVGSRRLLMNRYTAGLFTKGLPEGSEVREDFLYAAGPDDFCFVENAALASFADDVDEVYVFFWNRLYPADKRLDLDLTGWTMTPLDEFSGASHSRITLVRYTRPAPEAESNLT